MKNEIKKFESALVHRKAVPTWPAYGKELKQTIKNYNILKQSFGKSKSQWMESNMALNCLTPANARLATVKSPKSIAFPVDAIVT